MALRRQKERADVIEVRRGDWDPALAEVSLKERVWPAELLAAARDVAVSPPNGRKFSLVGLAKGQQGQLKLELAETDYFTLKRLEAALKEEPDLKRRFADKDPAKSQIPHAFCLHYLARFPNGDLLAKRRGVQLAFHPGRWSVSGEEQFDESDLSAIDPLGSLFRRAVLEEVLPLKTTPFGDVDLWQVAHAAVKRFHVAGFYVEAPIWHFTVFGVIDLAPPHEFRTLVQDLERLGALRDDEGEYCLLPREQAERLRAGQSATAKSLLQGGDQVIEVDRLHPTTRYRLDQLGRLD